MSVTLQFDDTENVRLTEATVETRSADRIEFVVAGSLTITDALLGQFEGATLDPVRVTVSADGTDAVPIDLTDRASLRLDAVDVGVATPDGADVAAGIDALSPTTDGGPDSLDSPPDVLSFTVHGEIRDVPTETIETIAGDSPTVESLTFAVEKSVRSDGGSGTDVIFELDLLGYGIIVRRDGSIVVGSGGPLASIDLP
ncbi:hypothetical protein ACFO5R_15940 [Halosolutus amylolyticus]|uniref:Uncharacterized protein n=1 Tax=Halosolutus amylolyticus TaxID=2932267 RepID=A0ABD5PS46_9EURY|nr:hypothetical protein [Halosolutus amylolyticus]